MQIPRRTFIKLSSLATVSAPFLFQGCMSDQSRLGPADISSEHLFRIFKNPPNTARVFVRWWWNGDRLTEKEIIRELDIMKEAGIGGVEINPIRFPYGADPVEYKALEWLSDEWINLLQVTLQAAKERDIICDTIVGSGWPFGGEFLEKEEQTQLMTFETTDLEGPGIFQFQKQSLLDPVDPAIHSKYEKVFKEITDLRLVPAEMNEFVPGIDLSAQLKSDRIEVQVPEGKYVLYYLVKLTGFQAVINGAPGAAGPVLNHYNQAAVKKYLNRMSSRLIERLGSLGNHFRAMFCDSLEMEGANWVDDLPDEFMKRRGYDLMPFLPFVLYKIGHMGNPVEEPYGARFSVEVEKTIRRVRYDFYITRLELFKERFIDTFNNWCHHNGVKSRIQAYGRGYHPLNSSMYIDVPECETWLRETVGSEFANTGWQGRAYSVINKFVSSGARLAGNRLVSCEEITNTSMVFNATLELVKITGDQSNLSGVTHSVLHGFNYSPPDAPFPGWIQYGTFFNEKNPWWPYFRLWSDYKARLSAVFQQADPYADIAILHPLADLWMKYGPQRDPFPVVKYPEYQHNVWEAIQQSGFGCDYVSELILGNAIFQDGEMRYGDRVYKALLLLEVETILPETAEAISRFARSGGKIIYIGKIPNGSPGYVNQEKNDRRVKNIMDQISGKYPEKVGNFPAPEGSLIEWFRKMADQFDLQPYMKITNSDPFINQVYFKTRDLDIFFISHYNLGGFKTLELEFDFPGKVPWIWDPETGERKLLPEKGSFNQLSIELGPAETKLLVFDRKKEGEVLTAAPSFNQNTLNLEGPWDIRLDHVDGSSVELKIDELIDSNLDRNLKSFAGTLVYDNRIIAEHPDEYHCIDLGQVSGISEVMMNGKSLGIRWYGRHRFPLDNNLQKGGNDIRIKITTVLGNYMKSLEDNPTAQRWTNGQSYHSIGMLGPVKLM